MQPKPPPRGPLAGPSYQPPSSPPVPNASPRQATGEGGLHSSNQYLRTPVVRYSSRMRLGKLHPLKVSLTGSNGEVESLRPQSQSGNFDPPVVVQVSVPGAIVTPPHVIIPVSGGEAQFVVQPIMTGRLSGARVEFLSQGRKVSEVLLPMKVNRGYLAKFFLLLAILLPFLIHFMPMPTHVSKLSNKKQIGNNNNNIREGRTVRALASLDGSPEPNSLSQTQLHQLVESTILILDVKKAGDSKQAQDKTGEPKKSESKQAPKQEKSLVDGTEQDKQTRKETTPQGGEGGANRSSVQGNPPANLNPDAITVAGISYTGEDAIWAWTRSRLEREGYRTELFQDDLGSSLPQLLAVEKRYKIVKESNAEWSTSRLFAIIAHYSESTVRLLYRLFIEFPKSWPFGDLILSLAFLALSAIFWMYTGPNRRKIKGPTMDIRFAAA
jgi:hypothetical protein